jgi:DNA polymerase elongation subunit (family B)
MGNNLLIRGVENSVRFAKKIPCKPYLFLPSQDVSALYQTIHDKKVEKINFDSPREARDFIKTYEDVAGYEIYGSDKFQYVQINDMYKGAVEYDPTLINVIYMDIEVASDAGFPDIQKADKEVTAITLRKNDEYVVFGCKDFISPNEKIKYFKCKDESTLLTSFLKIWNTKQWSPDVITGWYIEFFDIPYLVHRIRNVLGEEVAKTLSPWGVLEESKIFTKGREQQSFTPLGIAVLDYISLYDKFTYEKRESKKLDYIAKVELGKEKLDYSEYGSLLELYKNNFQKFIEYNIRDVDLVFELNEKLRLIELVFAQAYDAKVNYRDVFGTVKPWEIIIHNYLLDQRRVVPQFKFKPVTHTIAGGFVKEPVPGSYDWVVSFDLTSLYPSLIMQYNISPDTIVDTYEVTEDIEIVDRFLNKSIDIPENLSLAANMTTYRKDKEGFLPALMSKVFEDRKKYKNQMIEAKQKLVIAKKENKDEDVLILKKEISRLDNLQMAKKIQLNSLYGATSNQYFLFFDTKYAEAITFSGQLSARWIAKSLNIYFNNILKTNELDYVIAIDTDSVYLNFGSFVNKVCKNKTNIEIVKILDKFCKEKIDPFLAQEYEKLFSYMNAFQNKMHMKREAIASRGVWTAKKRYILNVYDNEGVLYDKPELKITGIEAIRSSTPEFMRDLIKETISYAMNSSEQEMQDMVAEKKKKFYNSPFDVVSFPRGVNGLDLYSDSSTIYKKATPIHVRGSLLYNYYLKENALGDKYTPIYEGDKIKFVYLKKPNSIKENVIAAPEGVLPKEFKLDGFIDYDVQWEKSFEEPIANILQHMGWKTEKNYSLEEFF